MFVKVNSDNWHNKLNKARRFTVCYLAEANSPTLTWLMSSLQQSPPLVPRMMLQFGLCVLSLHSTVARLITGSSSPRRHSLVVHSLYAQITFANALLLPDVYFVLFIRSA